MKTCCFIGHRRITEKEILSPSIKKAIEELIVTQKANTFLFGSKSQFDDLCLAIVTELKEKYPNIERIYIRTAYQYIDKDYESYLLEYYDKTQFPDKVENAGKLSYIIRNQEMIDKSDFCIFYYDEKYKPPAKKSRRQLLPTQSQSGTKLAFYYAMSKQKYIINILDLIK